MIHAVSTFKSLFSCFNPALNVLTGLFEKIFCCGGRKPVQPLNPDRVKAISPEEQKSSPKPLGDEPLAPDANPIPKNIVSDRVKDSYKRNREVVPSGLDANVFCGVTQPSERTFNLESEKRKKVIEKIQKAKHEPEEIRKKFEINAENERKARLEQVKNSRKRNKLLENLRKSREGATNEEWHAQYQAEDIKRQQRNKEIKEVHTNIKLKIEKEINEARDLDPAMPEVVYNENGFIYLRQKPEARKDVSKELIEAGFKRFKEHCKKHQITSIAADIDSEERKNEIAHAHAKVLSYIDNKRTSSSANFAQVMQGIASQPKLKVLNDNQVKALEVKKKFLEDLKRTLSNKKSSNPLIALNYFEAEFEQTRLPVTNEKLHEWRMKLNSLMDVKFDPFKESIAKLITLQTTINELPEYSVNTRYPILLESQKLLQELKIRVKGVIDFQRFSINRI